MTLTADNFVVTNATSADRAALNLALSYLSKSPTAMAFLQQAADKGVIINIVHDGRDQYFDGTIDWDPKSALAVITNTAGVGTVGVQSAALGLAHEAAHAIDPNPIAIQNTKDPIYDDLGERYAVGQENIIASDLGEPQRFNHKSGGVPTAENPTEHTAITPSGDWIWVQSDTAGNITPQGTYELGTYPLIAPQGGGTGSGTLTIDGSDITISPDFHRDVIIKGDNDTVIEDNASITVSSGGSATIVGNGNKVTLENTVDGTLELSGAGNTVKSGDDTISIGSGASAIDYNGQQKVTGVTTTFQNGSVQEKDFDPDNIHPYTELDVSKDSTGKVTAAQLALDQNIIAAGGSIGQIFGSAIGNALAPNDPFARILTSTVAGLIGQKLLLTFTASLTLDASRFVLGDFASVSGLDVAHAGIGAISSFLTAELGHEMHLDGLSGQLFNGIVGGVTGSVLNQVVDKIATGVSFDAAIGAIQWGTAVTQAGYNVSSIVGS
jgi:hypothetical protein